MLAGLTGRANPARGTSFTLGPLPAGKPLGSLLSRGSSRTSDLALGLLRLPPVRKFVACFPLHAFRVAGHHHPLQVDPMGQAASSFLGNEDIPVEVDPAVDRLQRLLAHGLAVDVEDHPVPEHAEVQLVPLVVEHLGFLPGEGL